MEKAVNFWEMLGGVEYRAIGKGGQPSSKRFKIGDNGELLNHDGSAVGGFKGCAWVPPGEASMFVPASNRNIPKRAPNPDPVIGEEYPIFELKPGFVYSKGIAYYTPTDKGLRQCNRDGSGLRLEAANISLDETRRFHCVGRKQ